MEKVFKAMGQCVHTGNTIDSPACRQCKWYFRAGTETFIWCSHEKAAGLAPAKRMAIATSVADERAKEAAQSKLPASKKTATGTPVSKNKRANKKTKQVKSKPVAKKRGRPKKAK